MSEFDEYMEGNGFGDEGIAPLRPALDTLAAWGTSYRAAGE